MNTIPSRFSANLCPRFEVAVIGGGPSGSVCARELARRGHRVALLERARRPAPRQGETCGPGLLRLLEGFCRLSPSSEVYSPLEAFYSSWGSDQLEARSFAFWQARDGLVLDRRAFDEWLLYEAGEAGVTVLRGLRLSRVSSSQDCWLLSIGNSSPVMSFMAEYIVEATGRASHSPVQDDAERIFTDKLMCLSTIFHARGPDEFGALVESCASGWWYGVLMKDGARLLAFFTDANLVGTRETCTKTFYESLGATHHAKRFAEEIPEGVVLRTIDARTSARRILWRGSWLCTGDAAWCLDPLSGNGVERAVKQGIDAAVAISEALTTKTTDSLNSFALSLAADFNSSLETQRSYYRAEARWKDSVFWRSHR